MRRVLIFVIVLCLLAAAAALFDEFVLHDQQASGPRETDREIIKREAGRMDAYCEDNPGECEGQ